MCQVRAVTNPQGGGAGRSRGGSNRGDRGKGHCGCPLARTGVTVLVQLTRTCQSEAVRQNRRAMRKPQRQQRRRSPPTRVRATGAGRAVRRSRRAVSAAHGTRGHHVSPGRAVGATPHAVAGAGALGPADGGAPGSGPGAKSTAAAAARQRVDRRGTRSARSRTPCISNRRSWCSPRADKRWPGRSGSRGKTARAAPTGQLAPPCRPGGRGAARRPSGARAAGGRPAPQMSRQDSSGPRRHRLVTQCAGGRDGSQAMKSMGGGTAPCRRSSLAHWARWP